MNRFRVEPARESVWNHPRLDAVLVTLAYAGRAKRMPEIAGPFEGEPGIWGW